MIYTKKLNKITLIVGLLLIIAIGILLNTQDNSVNVKSNEKSETLQKSTIDNEVQFQSSKPSIPRGNGMVTNIWIEGTDRLDAMRNHKIRYLFVDVGGTGKDGKLITPKPEIKEFIDLIKQYERQTNYNFIILPYSEVNGATYNLRSTKFYNNYINEYKTLVTMGFDGVFVDIEPVKALDRPAYIRILRGLKSTLPSKAIISAYGGSLVESTNPYEWNYDFYQQVSANTHIITLQGFDLDLQTSRQYKKYLKNQMLRINTYSWKSKFLLGVPTHNPTPETLGSALAVYNSVTSNNQGPFIGVSVFSEWTIDRNEWRTYELHMK